MGKKKTVLVGSETETKTAEKKKAVKGVGLKGGERVATVAAEPMANEPETTEKTVKKEKGNKTRSQKYQEAKAKVDRTRNYDLSEAIGLVKETSYSKFDGTVEVHMQVKKQGLTANLTLPHSTGSIKRIVVANDQVIQELRTGKVNFDVLLATPETMPKLVPFAKLLGPKGLMPNPKNGTLIKKESEAKSFSADTLTIKTEKKAPVIHTTAGKVSMKPAEIEDNIRAIFEAVGPKQVIKAYIKPTMGPSIKVEVK